MGKDEKEKKHLLKVQISEIQQENAEMKKQLADVLAKGQISTVVINNLNHEMRTPMNGIVGFSEVLADPLLEREEIAYYSKIIRESCDILINLTSDFMDITRIVTGHMSSHLESCDLNELMKKLYIHFKPIAEKKQIQLFLENITTVPFVLNIDARLVERVLFKLLDNAVKFTKAGWVRFRYLVADGIVEFQIEDTGIGIPEEFHSRLFNCFLTEDASKLKSLGGTGLSLAFCKSVVEFLKGKIWFTSIEKNGSSFHFSIPL